MPERCVKGRCGRPGNPQPLLTFVFIIFAFTSLWVCGISVSRIILELPYRPCPRETVAHVCDVCLRAHDGEGFRVDLIHAVAGVEACERGNGGADVCDLEGVGEVNLGGVAEVVGCVGGGVGVGVGNGSEGGGKVVVEELDLVLVGVSERWSVGLS